MLNFGTTAYSSQTPENFRYRVVLWSSEYHLQPEFWYVHDTWKGTFRKIGRISGKGINYYDRAIAFCRSKQLEVNK